MAATTNNNKSFTFFLTTFSIFLLFLLTTSQAESRSRAKRPGTYDRFFGARCKTPDDCSMNSKLVCHDKIKKCVCAYRITQWNPETLTCEEIRSQGQGQEQGQEQETEGKPTVKPTRPPRPPKPPKPSKTTSRPPAGKKTTQSSGDSFEEQTTRGQGNEDQGATTPDHEWRRTTGAGDIEPFTPTESECCPCHGRKRKRHYYERE